MNRYAKITASILLTVSILSAVGCGKKKDAGPSGNFPSAGETAVVEGTTHKVSVKPTAYKMAENGATDYKILVKSEDRSAYGEAISELTEIFRQATGARLEVAEDEGLGYSDNAKYISLGETAAFVGSGIFADYDLLGTQGYRIRTKGKSVFIAGEPQGILYGVYDFLNKTVGFEVYSNKVTYYENKSDVILPDMDITEVPDILYRVPVTGGQLNNRTVYRRMRTQKNDEIIIGKGFAHNMLRYIVPLEENVEDHPMWFSGDRTQLCYTAHGDGEEYEAMVEKAVENVERIIDETPNQNVMSLTQMDVQTWCECETCQALEDKYGTNAASQIFFVNEVTSRVKNWLDTERGGRDVRFMFFAYHKSEGAPATQNEDGTWTAIDGIKVNDNVSVWIAPIYEDYTVSVKDPTSVNTRVLMESWHAVASSYFVWAYNVYFDNYLIPYDSYGAIKDLVQYFVSHNTRFLWPQGNWNSYNNTGYDDLKGYLFAKLMWNCNLDVNELISDYFAKVYREAGDIMERTFWSWRAFSESQRALGRSGNIYSSPAEGRFWPKRYLMSQLELMEQAKELVKKYETTDPALYKSITDSIDGETMSPRYLLIKLHSTTFGKEKLAELKSSFAYDANRLDFNMISERAVFNGFND